MNTDVDCIVAGGGVVGLAVARALARAGTEVIVLERAGHIGTETSSRSSEVVHAGIYYPPGSLKSTLCVRGRDLLYDFCERKGIAYARLGKLIVATDAADRAKLDYYQARAAAAGVELTQLSAVEARELEPELRCAAALWSPMTGIVDSHELMLGLLADIEARDGTIVCNTEVGGVTPSNEGFNVVTNDGTIGSRMFVNSAGLGAQALARRISGLGASLIPPEYYAIGHYYTLVGRSPFRHLVYPTAGDHGLGIHVTLDTAGQARFGPDVRWLDDVNYAFDDSRRDEFISAVATYYPDVRNRELAPGYTGIRPKLVGPGQPAADFVVSGVDQHGIPGLINLFGIESPGLTAALAIGEYVAKMLD